MNFGFIGLGRMGNHMARHLAEAGNQVAAFDLRPEAVSSLAETRGVRPARGVGGAALNAAVVCTSLPGPKEVEAVVLAPGGLLESMQPGSTYVDLSTNSPTLVRRLASALAERGIAMLDAPVSGGVAGAEAATLSVMVGGDEAVFERLRPALAPIGSKLFYCGASGAGNVVKLCNNIAGQGYALVLGEVLTLGVKAGVDLKTLAKVIGNSTGTSTRLTRAFPRRLFRRNFESPGFSALLSAKDTDLALALAAEVGVPLSAGSAVDRDLKFALDQGWGELDFDVIVRAQEERTGVRLELTPDEIEALTESQQ